MSEGPLLTSTRNPLVRRLAALHEAKERAAARSFLAEGPKLVEQALAAGLVPIDALVSPRLARSARGSELESALRAAAVRVIRAEDRVLDAVSAAESHQGIVVALPLSPSPLATDPSPDRERLLILAVGVQDPGNLGALVRIAEAFGAAALLAAGGADPWAPKAVRAAAGSLFRLPVARTGEATAATATLAAKGYRLAAAVPRGGEAPGPELGQAPLALVLGAEGSGLGEEVLALCDRKLTIPLAPAVESLNVAAAAAVLLYALSER